MTIEEIAEELQQILGDAMLNKQHFSCNSLFEPIRKLSHKVGETVMDRRREAGVRQP